MYIERFQVYRVSIVLQLNASVHLYIDASTHLYILHSKQCTERFINEFWTFLPLPLRVTFLCADLLLSRFNFADREYFKTAQRLFMVEEWILKG